MFFSHDKSRNNQRRPPCVKWILLEQTTLSFHQVWSVSQGAFSAGYNLVHSSALGQGPPTVFINTWATHTHTHTHTHTQLVKKK